MMVTAAEPWRNSTELFITLPGRDRRCGLTHFG